MRYALLALSGLAWAAVARAGLGDRLLPEAYVDPIDQQIARTGVGVPGRPSPCTREEVMNGVKVLVGQPTELCVRMLPPEHFKGLWRAAFEGSQFCPEPAKTCDGKTPGDRTWLNHYPGRLSGGLYRVEFVGRRTMYKGAYGHFGVYDQEVTVDKAIRFELIEDRKK